MSILNRIKIQNYHQYICMLSSSSLVKLKYCLCCLRKQISSELFSCIICIMKQVAINVSWVWILTQCFVFKVWNLKCSIFPLCIGYIIIYYPPCSLFPQLPSCRLDSMFPRISQFNLFNFGFSYFIPLRSVLIESSLYINLFLPVSVSCIGVLIQFHIICRLQILTKCLLSLGKKYFLHEGK